MPEEMNTPVVPEEEAPATFDHDEFQKTWDEVYQEVCEAEKVKEAPLEPIKPRHNQRKERRRKAKTKAAKTALLAVVIGFCIGFLPYVFTGWRENPYLWIVPVTPCVLYLIWSLTRDFQNWVKKDED